MKPELAKRVERIAADGTVTVDLTLTPEFQNHCADIELQLHQLTHDAITLAVNELEAQRVEDNNHPVEVNLSIGSMDYSLISESGTVTVECVSNINPVYGLLADAFGEFSYSHY